ncbi:2-dehydropantoate 2-reductase [Candidatus Woesearchaeota archaeon]|nr:2-dehydropantoate 2-reductase [Candidatus Woesearchaeota archaeon]
MDIIIFGAGAIGSLYGAKLSKLNEVTLIGRKEHIGKINKHGLRITGLENKRYHLNALTGIEKIGKDTLIVLTTKAQDSKKAISSIKHLVRKDTTILCLQNGLYSENAVKSIIKNKCLVLRAVTNFGAAFLNPGAVKYNSYSYTAIEKSKKSREIALNFRQCGLNGYVSKNIRQDMWKKLVLNCVLNPITSILRVENKLISDRRLDALKELVAGECIAVAKKDGIIFEFDFVKEINSTFKNSTNTSSMLQDLMKGRKTEIGYLNGAVAELGRKYGVKCPANEALTKLIKEIEVQCTGTS